MDNVLAFGLETRGFESPRSRSKSPLGSPLLAAAAFMKNDVYCILLIRELTDERYKEFSQYATLAVVER